MAFQTEIATAVYLSLGSNTGDRKSYLQKALEALSAKVQILKISPIYETPSWGFEGNDFYNLCLMGETRLSAAALLPFILDIEKRLNRVRHAGQGYQNRTIDIDILFFGGQVIQTPSLQIPHPRIGQRLFVLKPLSDIAPKLAHPVEGYSIAELLAKCPDKGPIAKLSEHIPNDDSDTHGDV